MVGKYFALAHLHNFQADEVATVIVLSLSPACPCTCRSATSGEHRQFYPIFHTAGIHTANAAGAVDRPPGRFRAVASIRPIIKFAWLAAGPTSATTRPESGFTLPHSCQVLHAQHCERSEPTASVGEDVIAADQSFFQVDIAGM